MTKQHINTPQYNELWGTLNEKGTKITIIIKLENPFRKRLGRVLQLNEHTSRHRRTV
ncbi:MAG: hypothetical protein ACP5NY_07805 [Thermocladium sp.]